MKAITPIKAYREQIEAAKKNIHKENYWKLITGVIKRVDEKMLTKLGYNFFVNTLLIGVQKKQ